MLHMLLCPDWTANRDEILRRIGADVAARRGNRILLVPELISHETERALCRVAGDTASRYAEVLSFTRLAGRVSEATGVAMEACLDNGGRVAAMAAAAQQLSSKLKSYAAVETKPEFLTGLIDAVDEFKRCCITPETLRRAAGETEGSLAQKLEELALLMESYDSLCAQGKRDPRDQMHWLLEQLEDSNFAQTHVFYIDGFPDFTRQHLAILEHLIASGTEVTLALNCDSVTTGRMAFEKAAQTAGAILRCAKKCGVEIQIETLAEPKRPLENLRKLLFQGKIPENLAETGLSTAFVRSPWQECMAAAYRIRDLVSSGCRYRDITLVITDSQVYDSLAGLIFRRMHIPVYQAGTETILEKSVIATVLTALNAVISGWDRRNMMEYLRSPLSPLSQEECDLVENYAIIWDVRGQQWYSDWTSHPDGLKDDWSENDRNRLAELNRLRILAVSPLGKLQQSLHRAVCVREQVLGLYDFLTDVDMARRLAELAEQMDRAGDGRSAQILNQLWEILLTALEQMYDILGDTHWEDEHFLRLLRLLLSQYEVGTIPPVLDAVQMGSVSAMRCHSGKHLILLGAQEGSLPGYSGSTGVLTDKERVALRTLGVPLTGGAMEGIQAEFAEIYGCFCGAEKSVYVTCPSEQPSFVFRRLAAMAEKSREGFVGEDMDFAIADPVEAGAWLARRERVQAARELGVEEIYRQILTCRDYMLGTVTPENVRGLYGSQLLLSASQIDTQAECRMSYFLKYGLRAKERKEATVDPAEFGTYVHAVLEQTARQVMSLGGFHEVSLEDTLKIAGEFSDEYAKNHFGALTSERMKYLFRRNLNEVEMVVRELWEELSQSEFAPCGFEVFFGDHTLDAIDIPNRGIPASLRGYVDRVDAWQSPGNRYYRVVDYKTGKKDFDYTDIENGVGLQMLLYLFALEQSGKLLLGENAKPAGVQYFPARAEFISVKEDGKDTPEAAREKEWKRKGLLLKDEAVLQAMEPCGEKKPKRMDYSVAKDGSLTGNVADREQLKLLRRHVFRVLGELVEQIASGCVDPNPYRRGSSHDACRFCPFGSVCRKDSVTGGRNFERRKAEEFWKELEEEEHHG